MIDAGSVEVGQWLMQPSGAYLVDAVAVQGGRAYIGTNRGVVVLPSNAPVLIAG